MTLPASKKVSVSLAVVVLLFFSAASFYFYFSVYARSSRSYDIDTQKMQSNTWEDKKDEESFQDRLSLLGLGDKTKHEYQSYSVLLWKHPNGGDEAMGDDKDARRRWYESFLPSTHTDDGERERRLLFCEESPWNGFIALLTRDEASALADKPGIQKMYFMSDFGPYVTSEASCGFETTGSSKRKIRRS